jgi:regulator of sigma E protease
MVVLIFILVLSVLVIIHELGHFLLAKKHGIQVDEFGIGYPPRFLKLFTWRGTLFSLNAIPFGGFVQMKGEEGEDPSQSGEQVISKPQKDAFYQKSLSAKLQVTLAGIVFNLIFGVLSFAVIFSNLGIPEPLFDQVRLSMVQEGSPAAAAGLRENTNILALYSDGQWLEVKNITQVQEFVAAHLGQTVGVKTTLSCMESSCPAESTYHELYLRTKEETPENEGAMGVQFQETIYKKYPWYKMIFYSVWHGLQQSLALSMLILQTLGQLVTDLFQGKQIDGAVAGPIGIVDQVQRYGLFEGGWLSILNFAALLSVNLAIMNLLPIPALDGGRVVLLIVEKIFKRQRVEKIARYLNYAGYIFLLSLMVLVSFNDIRNIFIR